MQHKEISPQAIGVVSEKVKPAKAGIYHHQHNRPSIYGTQLDATRYIISITDDVNSPHLYDEVVALLSTASENDEIVFNINSYGGYVDTLNMLVGWKAMCPARQVHVLMGNASSAATALFLSHADEYVIGDHASFMIHEFQVGTGGTESNSFRQSEFNHKRNHEFVRETYEGFLTEDEIENQVLKGLEIYLGAEEIKERLVARDQKRQDEAALELSKVDDLSAFPLDQLETAHQRYVERTKDIKREIKKRKKSQEK